MYLHAIDIAIFLAFIVTVVTVGVVTSRKDEGDTAGYFLAGRGLPWWLIGFSLIAANISTEQFVGMSGNAADRVGLAIASYEWLAAVTLVVVAFGFLPFFLRTGIYTIPEFLEHRYNRLTRSLMALFTVLVYVLLVAAVTYSGALTIKTAFAGQSLFGVIPVNLTTGAWLIGLTAGAYVVTGGLKACAWADLIQGGALIVGGGVILYFALHALGDAPAADLATTAPSPPDLGTAGGLAGGLDRFAALNRHKMHMALPGTDPYLPWTTLLLGLWIPNFYYWGLNQYIMQRTLGSRSLGQGQRGIVFAAFLKLLIPFIIVIPGMIAFNLFSRDMQGAAAEDNARVLARFDKARAGTEAAAVLFTADDAWKRLHPAEAADLDAHNTRVRTATHDREPEEEHLIGYKYDTAFAHLVSRVLPEGSGWQGFVLAALLGAVVSTLAAMLNAASTILTMDLYRLYVAPDASQSRLVRLGRIAVGVFMVLGCLIAPELGNPSIGNSIFALIQESQAYIYSGILAVFVFGTLVRRAPPAAGVAGLLLGPLSFWLLKVLLPSLSFVNRSVVSFLLCLAAMGLITLARPLPAPVQFKTDTTIDLAPSRLAVAAGAVVLALTAGLYFLFW